MHHPPQGPRLHRKNSIRTFYRRATKSSIPATYFSPSLTFDHLVRGSLGKVPNQYRTPRWVGRLPLVRRGHVFDPGSSLDGGDQRAPCIAGARTRRQPVYRCYEFYAWGLRTQTIWLPAALGTTIIDRKVADVGRNIGVLQKIKWCRRERSFDRRGSDRAGCSVRVSGAAPLHRVHLHNTSLGARFAREPVRTGMDYLGPDRLARKQSHKTVPETKKCAHVISFAITWREDKYASENLLVPCPT